MIGLLGECLKQVHRPQYGRRLHPYLSEPAVEYVLNLSATIDLSNCPVSHQSKVGVVASDDQRVRLKREQVSPEAVRPGVRSRQDLTNQLDLIGRECIHFPGLQLLHAFAAIGHRDHFGVDEVLAGFPSFARVFGLTTSTML